MKIRKKKAMLIGLAASTVFAVGGCRENQQETVYGPPQGIDTEVGTEQNQNVEVYGPPADLNTEKKTENKTESTTAPPTVDDNEPVAVYGPPEDF